MANFDASRATIERLPLYLRFLREENSKGMQYVSSATLADAMHVSSILVRKDLALVSSAAGRPRFGFAVKGLIYDIEKLLGYHNDAEAVIVGLGGLGRAILGYEGFKNYGINIAAAFDIDPSLVGQDVAGKHIYHINEVKETVKKLGVSIAILTIPKSAAQDVFDELVDAGIKAVWNFAPVHLKVPDGVSVRNEDLAASLAILASGLL